MNLWYQIPFLRLLFPFLAGILTAIYTEWQIDYLNYILLGIFFIIILFVFVRQLNISYSYSSIFGLLIVVALFLSGFQLTVLNTEKWHPNHFSKFLTEAELFYAKSTEPYLEKQKSYKIKMKILSVRKNGQWIKTTGKAMCYFKKDSIAKQIRYGDCMILKTKFTEVEPPQNPSEFNYKKFLSFHNIYHQAYIQSGNWKSLNRNEGNFILRVSFDLREHLLNIYRENKISGDEFAVGSALVLGYEDKLDQELISAYSSSGALHVLSVSGLHVGIVYFIFNILLMFLEKIKHGKIIKLFLLFFILWFYATLTGLSPSVLRATTMFSFIVIAKAWKYDTNIFNTLAVSCFVLLLYNPYMIMGVGFQLSFLAVLGIVSIQPWIYEKWQPDNWLMNQIWLIVSVSIAAQVATFPLGLLYFHQFPNYFLFSNLIVIPLSSLILFFGLFVFAVGKIAVVGSFCAKIFSFTVLALNESVRFIDKMPGSLTQGISINVFETWMIYFLIIIILLFLFYKQIKYLIISLVVIVFLLSLQIVEEIHEREQNIFVVYNIPKISAYDFSIGKENVLLADSSLICNNSKMLFHVKHNWWEKGITKHTVLYSNAVQEFANEKIFIKNRFVNIAGKKIIIINSIVKIDYTRKEKIKIDYIILSKNTKATIHDLQKLFEFKKVIIDSSNSNYKNEIWKEECKILKVNCYSVIDRGAYEEKI
ncbi:MAG: ComEC/Rec2 family competence protein [Bacteroidota bacterium]